MAGLPGPDKRSPHDMNSVSTVYDERNVVSGTSRTDRSVFHMMLQKTSSAPTQLTPEQQRLAEDLMRCHGNVRVAREANGLHFYIACPDCLGGDKGESELWKMHLAMNVDKYIRGNVGAAQCMRTGKLFKIDELTM